MPAARAQHETDRSVRSTEPIRLSSNESNYGVSQMATMGIMQSAEAIMRYPHQLITDLTAAIAAHEKVEPAQIALGFGSADVLEVLANHLGPKKGEVIAPNPTFFFFSEAMKRQGATVVNVPLTSKLSVDLDAMASKVTAETRCLYLVNPNNPTGTLLPGAQLRPFVIEMAKKCLVVVDEAYLDYSDDYESNTLVDLVRAGHNVVITSTFSKIHGMAGQRVGYGIMPAALVKEVFGRSMLSGGFRINLLGAVAAKASLEDAAFRVEVQAKNKTERDKFCALLKSLKREYAEPQGSFVFFNTGMATEEFRTKMRAENILTGNGHPLYPNWCRITLGVPNEMVRVEAALKKILV
ncbi:MAG TPA: histidinol-phosphate transaminase [Opitutaceae bacterium]|nr:histidinol-phosphate transaminase [Opitutaceae bacterium]